MKEASELLGLIEELERRKRETLLFQMYPEQGPFRRGLYPKHMRFFEAGNGHRERCMLAANRVGKSFGAGGYEVALHLTGLYPDWWQGRRFNHPVQVWAAGESSKTTRDTIQKILLGDFHRQGTGLIPGDCIVNTTPKAGIPNAVEDIYVKHVSGGMSHVGLKSYEQGVGSFMGTSKHVIWLDEEPPMDVYSECLIRTMIVEGEAVGVQDTGMIIATFTPLKGLSDVVLHFLPGGQWPTDSAERFVVQVTWDEVPHLTKEMKESLWAALPPHLREARSTGRPQLGSGAIYPVEEDQLKVEPFDIPPHWPKVYGLDVGWKKTACVWGAWDRSSDTIYLYSEHYLGGEIAPVHASAIKARGAWIPGVIDPTSAYGATRDGTYWMDAYRGEGLLLDAADNAVEVGIEQVRIRMTTGRLKVFKTLVNWFDECRIYRRDKNGKVVKDKDHLMDATRYLVNSGLKYAMTEPAENDEIEYVSETGRSKVCGY